MFDVSSEKKTFILAPNLHVSGLWTLDVEHISSDERDHVPLALKNIIKTGIDDDHRDCRECVVHPTSSMLTRHKAQPAQRQNEEVEKKTSRIVAQLMNYSEIILAVRYLPSSRILVIQLKRLVYKSL